MYESELKKKNELDSNLKELKKDLEDIDVAFPKEIQEYKKQIAEAKLTTTDYEGKTKVLAEELKVLKA